jgi:hypothetical protein
VTISSENAFEVLQRCRWAKELPEAEGGEAEVDEEVLDLTEKARVHEEQRKMVELTIEFLMYRKSGIRS